VSAGHAYRDDGWCTHEECLRHRRDPPDFLNCPDAAGHRFRYRSDAPPDKVAAWRKRWGTKFSDLILSLFRP